MCNLLNNLRRNDKSDKGIMNGLIQQIYFDWNE